MSLKTETLAYFTALVLVLSYGVTGTYILGSHGGFNEPIVNPTEALYFTVATISTVGYGDIYPVTTEARLFAISLIVIGIGVFLGAVVTLSGEFVSRRVENLRTRVPLLEKGVLNKHTVLIGTNITNQYLARKLKEENQRYLIISSVKDYVDDLRSDGLRAFAGDYTSEKEMRNFGVEKARAIVIDLRDNSKTVYALIVAMEMAPKAKIIVVSPTMEAAKHMQHISKGKAIIVNPAEIAANAVAENLFG
ncbi:MAG: NAD-binding protein [Candidatus Micrarchaeota archaeon]|nr:NAD-binding protein [Candidatus Micrarchaeota archaeon]